MKKRILPLFLALLFVFMCASMGLAAEKRASTSGCTVASTYFTGSTLSDDTETRISISVTLRRRAGTTGSWEYVDNAFNASESSKRVSVTKNCSLEGGYYYKAFATHYTTSKGYWTSESNQVWVPR